MEERPLISNEDGQEDEFSADPPEEKSLFDSEFFDKWLGREPKEETQDSGFDDEEDDDDSKESTKPKGRFRKLFQSVFPSIVESKTSEEGSVEPIDFFPDREEVPAPEESELTIDHTTESKPVEPLEEKLPEEEAQIEEAPEPLEDYQGELGQLAYEDIDVAPEHEEPVDQVEIRAPIIPELPEQEKIIIHKEVQPEHVVESVAEAAAATVIAKEAASRENRIEKEVKIDKPQKEVRGHETSKPKELVVEADEKEEPKIEKKPEVSKPEKIHTKQEKPKTPEAKPKVKHEIIEKREAKEKEIDFDRRHEVMSTETDNIKIDSKETLSQPKDNEPVSIAAILASKTLPEQSPERYKTEQYSKSVQPRTKTQQASTSYKHSIRTGFVAGIAIIIFAALTLALRGL